MGNKPKSAINVQMKVGHPHPLTPPRTHATRRTGRISQSIPQSIPPVKHVRFCLLFPRSSSQNVSGTQASTEALTSKRGPFRGLGGSFSACCTGGLDEYGGTWILAWRPGVPTAQESTRVYTETSWLIPRLFPSSNHKLSFENRDTCYGRVGMDFSFFCCPLRSSEGME
ncbi:hypothetical protein BD289DRAFT_153229 [Coniella lustricola]|uniref:Uncharacterized protein n=1 Tax=Coniella lustricola TaxID=2025994 RepID=A0A2T2ZUP9_9PEZI|nr:hypothetical protein BD289DRAFT_153229 [Coniella lustricola]